MGLVDCSSLGVRLARGLRAAFGQHAAVLADKHAADARVRIGHADGEFGQVQGSPHEGDVGLGGLAGSIASQFAGRRFVVGPGTWPILSG